MIPKAINRFLELSGIFLGVSVCLLLTSGCNIFDVTNEGEIMEEDLNAPVAIGAIVAGAGSDLSVAYGDLANVPLFSGMLCDEIQHVGSYASFKDVYYENRVIQIDQVFMNNFYSDCAVARWSADDGARRIKEVLGDEANSSPDVAEILVYSGFAHLALGDVFGSVPIDGGPLISQQEVYQRAANKFTEAITVGQAAGAGEWVEAARAGRARAYYSMDEFALAVADAQQVPADYRFDARFAEGSDDEKNWNYWANITRLEVSVSPEIVGLYEETNDSRIKSTFAGIGGDGVHDCYVQYKYTGYSSPIRLVGWQEMELIQAEAKLNAGDLAGAVAHINTVRAAALNDSTGVPMEARTVSTNADEVRQWLIHERRVEFFYEGRRLQDCRHFDQLDLIKNDPPFIPISSWEADNNPNID
ncbi:RagB/SusD family nutrient uptake outer membrane protein [candidate division KSB1 bacterium]|nr:RagB/SusD family nutrient uptake outer membrane protein [candidate division KSB1 bacterium]